MPLFDTNPLTPRIPFQLNYTNERSTFLIRSTSTLSDTQEAHPPRETMRQLVRSWLYITLWAGTPKMPTCSEKSSQKKIK
jgi:hypothetical protein